MNENFQIYDIKKKELLLNNFCKCFEITLLSNPTKVKLNNLLIQGPVFSGILSYWLFISDNPI